MVRSLAISLPDFCICGKLSEKRSQVKACYWKRRIVRLTCKIELTDDKVANKESERCSAIELKMRNLSLEL